MAIDFFDAYERHWLGAELLFQNEYWANADHLYGLSAECGVKVLMCSFGMPVAPAGGPSNSHDRKHINELRARYEAYFSSGQVEYYGIDFAPFDDWCVNQRYEHRSNISKTTAQKHKNATEAIRSKIQRAERDGVIL